MSLTPAIGPAVEAALQKAVNFDWIPLSSPWVAAVKWIPNRGVALRFYQHRHYGPQVFQCVYPGTEEWLYEFFLVAPHPGKLVHQFLWHWPYVPTN